MSSNTTTTVPPLPANQQIAATLSDTADRRALRSRRLLWESLFALLQDHDWAAINVQMICDRADVARSTFYAHFPTKQDLLESGFSFGLAEIEQLAQMLHGDDLPTLAWLVDHLSQSQGFRRRLHGSAAGHAIMTRFRAMTRDLIRRDLIRAGHEVTEPDLTFLIGGIFATTEAWLAQGCLQPQTALIHGLRRQIDAVLHPAPA